ncbi:hypothetical protein TNCV_2399291 [Trichonephila clavipes]|uniref:Uncharacterized protein n=1 Tax=Trichonephila clavipes TaxID=2585209 RepID=A0A8X6SRL6_TRICX|nr:hypothetical protein TNCV_2399291 [Trichonephila clavipes]
MKLATTPTCCGTSKPQEGNPFTTHLAHHRRDVTIPWKPNCQISSAFACIVKDDIIWKNEMSPVPRR